MNDNKNLSKSLTDEKPEHFNELTVDQLKHVSGGGEFLPPLNNNPFEDIERSTTHDIDTKIRQGI